jgi:hypothetical protein
VAAKKRAAPKKNANTKKASHKMPKINEFKRAPPANRFRLPLFPIAPAPFVTLYWRKRVEDDLIGIDSLSGVARCPTDVRYWGQSDIAQASENVRL